MKPTILYLIRHAATANNLVHPPVLQGCKQDPPLDPIGIRQAEATRDFLAGRVFDACWCSPLIRARRTAEIITAPHGIVPQQVEALTECDLGRWEGGSWANIRIDEPENHDRFMADPSTFGYPEGENFSQVHLRSSTWIEQMLREQAGRTVLVVSHNIVNRTYLAGLIGIPPGQARRVTLNNCGVSVVTHSAGKTTLTTLNAAFHLDGIAT